MARGLAVCTLRRDGEHRLGVRTDAGVLDAREAAAILRMAAPATADELLQGEDGPCLEALVAAAGKSPAARKAFIDEARCTSVRW